MGHATFTCGNLTAVIGDNDAHDEHRAGYNGIFSLTSSEEADNLFVPAYAGLNLEHIYDGYEMDRSLIFEPRQAPMRFEQISENEALLHQPPTPHFGLESWTRFRLSEPHSIDFEFKCSPRKAVYHYGYIGLFWASYINAPHNKSIYFRSDSHWHQLCTQQHNDESTVLHAGDQTEIPFVEHYPQMLYNNFSPLRFHLPFYYGLFKEQVYLIMFDRTENTRFSHSPSGGGRSLDGEDTNPAWDFQYIIPSYTLNAEYGFQGRVVYKKFAGREDVIAEYEKWKGKK
ncbi:hypothetical protein HYR99_05320 [Candidatus Poribacteria bacterium]|nr:hypothetical protein [Candidatus Poribacteria bacterium]